MGYRSRAFFFFAPIEPSCEPAKSACKTSVWLNESGFWQPLTRKNVTGKSDLWSYQGGRVFPDSIGLTIQALK